MGERRRIERRPAEAVWLLDTDVLPDYEKAELSDCMLYVMTIEEDGYTSFNVQFTDIR